MKGMWYLIKVENENDIGTNEIERWKVVDSNQQSVNIGGDYNYQSMSIKCDKGTPAKKETDSAPTGKSLEERVKSLEKAMLDRIFNDVETEGNTELIKILYDTQPKANRWFQDEIAKVKQEMESRTEQLSDEHKELKTAFEAECELDHTVTNFHMNAIKKQGWELNSLKQQLSELQQAFVKYAICKETESPEEGKSFTAAEHIEPGQFVHRNPDGTISPCRKNDTPRGSSVQADEPKIMTIEEAERQIEHLEAHSDQLLSEPRWSLATHYIVAENVEKVCALKEWIENQKNIKPPEEPDIVEQIKAGENRLWELRKSVDCVAAIANSASETVSLKEHVIKLMSIHTGLNITGIRMCNKTYKIHYNCKEKGIYVELD